MAMGTQVALASMQSAPSAVGEVRSFGVLGKKGELSTRTFRPDMRLGLLPYTNSCSCSRTTNTGHGAWRTTRSAVLPMKTCLSPV
jgi:hypothetical protein